jgi:hypothetical protein
MFFATTLLSIESASSHILRSTDGLTWQDTEIQHDVTEKSFFGVGASDDVFVAVGPMGKVFTSTDGITWQKQDFGGEAQSCDEANLYDILWDGDRFIALGGSRLGLGGVVAMSLDGVTWGQHRLVRDSYGLFKAIAWSGETYVLSTLNMDGRIFYSPE